MFTSQLTTCHHIMLVTAWVRAHQLCTISIKMMDDDDNDDDYH